MGVLAPMLIFVLVKGYLRSELDRVVLSLLLSAVFEIGEIAFALDHQVTMHTALTFLSSRFVFGPQGLKKGAPWPLQSAFYGSAFFNLFVYDPNVGP